MKHCLYENCRDVPMQVMPPGHGYGSVRHSLLSMCTVIQNGVLHEPSYSSLQASCNESARDAHAQYGDDQIHYFALQTSLSLLLKKIILLLFDFLGLWAWVHNNWSKL